jgi:hypothetical protein
LKSDAKGNQIAILMHNSQDIVEMIAESDKRIFPWTRRRRRRRKGMQIKRTYSS